jgi:hypothetical protein
MSSQEHRLQGITKQQTQENNKRKASDMTITDCPMCNAPVPIEDRDAIKACLRCGADLARWRPKPAKSPELLVQDALPEVVAESNLGIGILGAFTGACVGVGLVFGFYLLAGFRFPLLGVGIGVLTGFGAKIFFKGTDNTLGVISGVVSLITVVGTLFLMYGEFPILSIISVVVSVSMAYRIASS